MKALFLLLLAGLLATAPASARDQKPKRTKTTTKKAFSHTTESGKGKSSNKAHFRRDNHPPTINLHPHDPERFNKARANKDYKYTNPK